jgi:phage-related protein
MTSKKTTTRKASKKTATRKVSKKRRKLKELRELTKKARAEVAELLARSQAGSIPPAELQTELVELDQGLKEMEIFEHTL